LYSAAAAVPMMGIVLLLDQYEIEPLWCTLLAGFGGATAAFMLGLLLTVALSPVAVELLRLGGRWARHLDPAALSTAIAEEAAKGLVIGALYWTVRRDFDAPTDAVVYSIMVAIGFAFSENVLHLSTDTKIQLDEVPVIALLVIRYFSHIAFTGLTGAGLALEMEEAPRINIVLWFVFAVTLHYFWDALPRVGWYVFLGRVLPFVILLVIAAKRFVHHEAGVITKYGGYCPIIQHYVEGEQEEFGDSPTRIEILAELLTQPWSRECRVRAAHFQAVSRLAFLRLNVDRGLLRVDAATRHREAVLLHRIKATSQALQARAAGAS